MNRKLYQALVTSLLILMSSATLHAKVHEYMLDNGMKILVKTDNRFPVVVSQIWYKVGSSYEHNGITGISHMLEHMMFKGTPDVPGGEFSRIIASLGGQENAFTSSDYTAYFQRLEKSRLETSFRLEADRMRNATIPEDEFLKERDVVAEERRLRTEDSPQAKAFEQFRAAAFVSSPYHHSVIGWMSDIQNYTVEDARNWYNHWYAPNNATLVVVGDVEPEQVLRMAKKHYGPIQPVEIPELKPRPEIPQSGERRLTLELPATIDYLMMGYKVPSLNTTSEEWEVYALEVLAWILDGGASSRFSKELLRDQQLEASTSVSYDLYSRLQTLLMLSAVPAREKNIEDVETALRAQIKRLQDELVSDEELQRIKTQIMAGAVYERDSIFYQAMQLGSLETVGIGWQADGQFVDKIRAVTREQIMAVAKKYLTDDRLTVAILDPQPMDTAAVSPAAGSNLRH
jgi:zinc protease